VSQVPPRNREDEPQDRSDQGSSRDPGGHRGRHRDQEDRAGPARPNGWRDVVRNDYEYPPEIDDLSRRDRRHAKKDWRRDDHAQRMAWLRDQRQAEPVSPVSIVVVIVLLAIIVLGIGGGLPKILGRDKTQEPVGLLTPAEPLPLPTGLGTSGVPTAGDSSQPESTDSTPPVQTVRPSAVAIADASRVVNAWAKLFYTRNPSTETYDQLVTNASQYTTAEMAASFAAQGDSTYDALKAEGGTSNVFSAVVSAPKEGTAPTDTTTRVSRFVNVVIDITGKQPRRIAVPLLVTVVPQDSTWAISDVDGGTGP
jgi:hypothetical protein